MPHSAITHSVVPGLVPGTHVFKIGPKVKTPIAGINPGMTKLKGSAMKSITVATLALLTATPALAQQGVSPTEIVVGTAQDLSGPVVALSKPAVNGMRMRIDEENAAGGVNGRKIVLEVVKHEERPARELRHRCDGGTRQ